MGPTEHLTWNHDDPPEGHAPYSKFILIHYNNPHVPQLERHPVPHKMFIHSRDFGNKMPYTTHIYGTGGQTKMQEGGI